MSNLGLHIHISSNVTIADIADLLWVTPTLIHPGTKYINSEAFVGPIQIIFREPWWDTQNLGNKNPWNLGLQLDAVSHWDMMRMLLALEICAYFHSEVGGYFLAAYDTGDPLFAMGDNGLLLQKGFEDYYSSYPLPCSSYQFCELPVP